MIELAPEFIRGYVSRGIAKGHIKLYFEAIKDYDRAIDNCLTRASSVPTDMKSYFDEECASAYDFRGDTKAGLKQQVEAIKDYDKAIELDPKREWAYWSRGNAKSALGQFFEAIRDFDKAIELDSKVATFYESRAIVKDALGQKTAGNADRAMVKKLNAN